MLVELLGNKAGSTASNNVLLETCSTSIQSILPILTAVGSIVDIPPA
jgi:hypothetical protein